MEENLCMHFSLYIGSIKTGHFSLLHQQTNRGAAQAAGNLNVNDSTISSIFYILLQLVISRKENVINHGY
jgi:hypothetical protein